MSWWSEYYKRPLKDPLLQEYTTEELAYEYFNAVERRKAEEEAIQAHSDKIEEAKAAADQAWADQMEAEEEAEESSDPREDPVNQAWMEEEIRKNKELFGDEFGEDLDLEFGQE